MISPPPGELFKETNDNSVGVLLTSGTARVRLASDAEKKAEEYMSNGPHTGPLTVLKVTHHGSRASSTPLFLSRFKPEIAVIQVGADNSSGHPPLKHLAPNPLLRSYLRQADYMGRAGDYPSTARWPWECYSVRPCGGCS